MLFARARRLHRARWRIDSTVATRPNYAQRVIVFVTRDGEKIDEYNKGEFTEKIYGGDVLTTDYYWIEGMEDWRPVSEYSVTMKTMKIEMDSPPPQSSAASPTTPAAEAGALGALRDWLKRKR